VTGDAPAVSVCIRAFARPDGLRAAIESVRAQSFQDFEIVVSDDSGGLEAVAESFADPRIRYHRNPRPAGQVANIVTAFGLARGQMLALLDDDDRWLPGFLEAAVDAFRADPALGVFFTDVYLEAGRRRMRRRSELVPGRHDAFLHRVLEDCPVVPSATVMRRAVWEQGERDYPLQPDAVGDTTMWIRAALAGWPFHYVNEPLAIYGMHPSQLSWRPGIEARWVKAFERFKFEDPECERLRRTRLAEGHLAAASTLLWRGRLREARSAVALAREAAPQALGARDWVALTGLRPRVTRLAAARPALLMAVIGAWWSVRPPVDPADSPEQLAALLDGVEGWLGLGEARALQQAAFRHGRLRSELAAVEIGSWKGRSTIALASGLRRAGWGVLHAIDPHEGSHTHALTGERNTYAELCANLRRAGLESFVEPVRALAADACAHFDSQSVGLLFVDGSHRCEDVLRDIELWRPRLAYGATVAFHDAFHFPGVRHALRSRVLSAGSGFDRPHFVQGTMFVTRVERDRSLSRSNLSRRRGLLALEQRRVYAGAVAGLRRVMPEGLRRRRRRAARG
jgi:GT2 family glycosyltransferase